MTTSDTLRDTRIHTTHGSGEIPAVGFGTLIPDPVVTKQAARTALEVGFRHLDCAERYRNEAAVGDAIQDAFKAGTPIIARSGSSLPSMRVAGDCNSTISTAISSTLRLHFNLATNRTRGTSTAE
jgi:hypothetical protein